MHANYGSNAYYADDVAAFVAAIPAEVLGVLASNSNFSVDQTQRDAWVIEIRVLQSALARLSGAIFLEFSVPRIGTRIDAVLVTKGVVFAIEFKVGESQFNREAINQVWDYALDLKNFHAASHNLPIVPLLVATSARATELRATEPHRDRVFPPITCNLESLPKIFNLMLGSIDHQECTPEKWGSSPYRPTPTIIEAAQALYAKHSVAEISRHDAGAKNLAITSNRIEVLIDEARQRSEKLIIFLTGVPGAGKTLVGLNVATKKRDQTQPTHAVFLSGNGPLVDVLQEALTRDEVSRLKKLQQHPRKGDVRQKIKAFIQNVHHFRDAGVRDINPPADHVVIFDEAQRAWNQEMTADFMQRKKKLIGFNRSEPEFLISYLDRHTDWAAIVCLVGGGQEINRGEAGISAWIDAVLSAFPTWHVHVSPELIDTEYAAGAALERLKGRANVFEDRSLHLSVSMRSFRAEHVSAFVKAVLDCEQIEATRVFQSISARYPIALTRNLETAKKWIRSHARGSERFGLVASSGAQRLKPHAIDIRVEINPIHWFLNDQDDTRSSFYLEDAATEFQVQGLELDWVCMTWDADLRFAESAWKYHSFVGTKWNHVHKHDRQQYLRNAYRVLLTRARQGMVIFVPQGDPTDATRAPEFYDSTFEFLASVGVPVIN